MCEERASDSPNAVLSADWLEMAAHWHALAGDGDGGATIARLMHGDRIAR